MSVHSGFRVHPWALHETTLDVDVLSQTESLLALSNGFLGVRGNLDEGEPHGIPGTYLNGLYELRPLPSAESQYGNPESSQTLIDVTNGKLLRLLVDDEPFDVRYGRLLAHDRLLDFRRGVLERSVAWRSPARRTVRVTSTRMVSFKRRAILTIAYEVEPLDHRVNVVVQSELVANEAIPYVPGDPRTATPTASPLVSEEHSARGTAAMLMHRTRRSGLRVAAAMDHVFEGTPEVRVVTESWPDSARVVAIDDLEPGQRLRIVKFVAYGWSGERTQPAVRDQVAAALLSAHTAGWERLLAEQRDYLDEFWATGDVELEDDPELQQAVRFALFQLLSAGARAEGRAIPAKGLTGTGYDGHSFWDTDLYVLPVLAYTVPEAAADALRWRHATLPAARERARNLGLAGAAYPWRTIHGEECSGYWPAATAAFHINADIASAVIQYVRATDDYAFGRDVGLEILVETARLWRSLGYFDRAGRFCIDGVTGPDEYTAVVRNNLYTNLMAMRNLLGAADACGRHPDRARALGVTPEEIAGWRAAADHVAVPYDETLGVHQQHEGFTELAPWSFATTRADQYPLLLHFPYFDLYRKQVVKQPDLVLAMQLFRDSFAPEQRARNFEYYEEITVRDSSLSACTEAIAAADAGHLGLAFDYASEAALADLHDLHHNTCDGLHLASLAGSWIALVMGFGGLRDYGERLAFAPCLPPGALRRLAFSILQRGRCLRVEVTTGTASYSLTRGTDPLRITHYGEPLIVGREPIVRPIPPAPERSAPQQPPGREPPHRSAL
jgi:alpha,alpha-trehalose phosphorylase